MYYLESLYLLYSHLVLLYLYRHELNWFVDNKIYSIPRGSKMKKIVSVFVATIIALSSFTGCGKVKINPNATLYIEDVEALKSTLQVYLYSLNLKQG